MPSARTAAALSPPPTTVRAVPGPLLREAMASATPRVPSAYGAISNTPIGPFQNTVRAPSSAAVNARTLSGPMSRPRRSAGIASAGTTSCSASALNAVAATTSTGSTTLPVARNFRQVSSWSSSSRLEPTSWPCALRKVKHMPPPTSSVSTLGSSASITDSLSLTFEPPSTTAYGRSGSSVRRRSTSTSVATSGPAACVSRSATS